jgi:hypothetical protein
MAGPKVRIIGNGPKMTIINPTTVKISMGVRGPKGSDGVSGGLYYEHTQLVAATVWTINHGLGGFPSVTTVESDGDEIKGDVTYVNANQITVTFSALVSGKAYLS